MQKPCGVLKSAMYNYRCKRSFSLHSSASLSSASLLARRKRNCRCFRSASWRALSFSTKEKSLSCSDAICSTFCFVPRRLRTAISCSITLRMVSLSACFTVFSNRFSWISNFCSPDFIFSSFLSNCNCSRSYSRLLSCRLNDTRKISFCFYSIFVIGSFPPIWRGKLSKKRLSLSFSAAKRFDVVGTYNSRFKAS